MAVARTTNAPTRKEEVWRLTIRLAALGVVVVVVVSEGVVVLPVAVGSSWAVGVVRPAGGSFTPAAPQKAVEY